MKATETNKDKAKELKLTSRLFLIGAIGTGVGWLFGAREPVVGILAVINLSNAIIWHPKVQNSMKQKQKEKEGTSE